MSVTCLYTADVLLAMDPDAPYELIEGEEILPGFRLPVADVFRDPLAS